MSDSHTLVVRPVVKSIITVVRTSKLVVRALSSGGAPGLTGSVGEIGLISGNGGPVAAGAENQHYLDLDTGDLYKYTTVGGWDQVGSLLGPPGADGEDGDAGRVIVETPIGLTVTDQDVIIVKAAIAPVSIILKAVEDAKEIFIKNRSSFDVEVFGAIEGDTSLIITPGSGYTFIPGDEDYTYA